MARLLSLARGVRAAGLRRRRSSASPPRDGSPRECGDTSRSGRYCRSSPRRCPRRSDSASCSSSAAADMIWPGLAVAALRDVDLFPRPLQRMRAVGREPFDRRDLGALHRRRPASSTSASACPSRAPCTRRTAPMPQPNFVPLRSSTSRSTQSRGMSGGTSTVVDLPFTLNEMDMWWSMAGRWSARPDPEEREQGRSASLYLSETQIRAHRR